MPISGNVYVSAGMLYAGQCYYGRIQIRYFVILMLRSFQLLLIAVSHSFPYHEIPRRHIT